MEDSSGGSLVEYAATLGLPGSCDYSAHLRSAFMVNPTPLPPSGGSITGDEPLAKYFSFSPDDASDGALPICDVAVIFRGRSGEELPPGYTLIRRTGRSIPVHGLLSSSPVAPTPSR
jgi:hypothetical protein